MPRGKSKSSGKRRINVVNVHLSPKSKQNLDRVCDDRGMTIKSLMGRLVGWVVECDKTEQALILGQLDSADVKSAADLLTRRKRPR